MKHFLFVLFLALPSILSGQNVYYYSQLESTRTEDGRTQYKESATNKPLKGECKVIASIRDKNTYYLTKYKNGFKTGTDVSYKRGRVEMECNYKDGWREGILKEYYSEGNPKREASFKNGKLDGKDLYFYTDGSIEKEINYKDGVQHGKEIAYDWQTREVSRELFFNNGKPDGKQTKRISSNVGDFTEIAVYEDGQLKDYKETHYPSGTLRKTKIAGKETLYRKDGSVEYERMYVNNRLEGEQKTFYPSGKLERISTYTDGYKQGPVKEFYQDGTLKLEENYDRDVRQGVSTEYYANGKKKSEWTYDGFNRTGPYKVYYDNGAIQEEGEADSDEYVYRKRYYKNGQLKSYSMVSNGVWTEVEKYDEDGKQL